MDSEPLSRLAELGRMISRHLRGCSAAQRDRDMQAHLAQVKSASERLHVTGLLSTSLMRLHRAYQESTAHGRRLPA